MIDLNKIVNDTLVEIERTGFVEQVVKKRLEKTITDIVDDVFKEWSDFGKNLKAYIENKLNINLENLGIEGYNTLVSLAVKEQLDKIITVQGIEKVKETIDKILIDTKDTYDLSDIIEKLKDGEYLYKDQYDFEEDEKITLFIEKEGYFTHIYLDTEEKDNKYLCGYQINIKEEKPYSIKLKGREINKDTILDGLYGIDEFLFKIYAHGSKIVLDNGTDPEDYDIYYREDY